MSSRRRREEPGSRIRRDRATPSRVRRSRGDAPEATSNPLLRFVGIALVAGAFAWFFFSTQQAPATFGFDRSGFQAQWNALVAERDDLGIFTVDATDWTDEEAGVFGFAFSPTMSILARVDGTPLEEVEELAFVGQPDIDGRDVVIAGMELVVALTEPDLTPAERTEVLSELAVLGTAPADPDQRTDVGDTEFRVAADPATGVLGIGARPAQLEG